MSNKTLNLIVLVLLISILGLLNYTEWILMTKIIEYSVDARLIHLLFFMCAIDVLFIAFFVPIYEACCDAIEPVLYNTTISFTELITLCKGLLYTLLAVITACLILWFLVLNHL